MKAKVFLYITYGIFFGLLATALVWLAASPPRGNVVTLLPTPTPTNITVYVSGAVVYPGVYSLPAGSRVGDAVNAAGGFAPGAEEENINLATLIVDGQQIDVPGIVDTGHVNAGRVNINTASVEELDSLPGVVWNWPSGCRWSLRQRANEQARMKRDGLLAAAKMVRAFSDVPAEERQRMFWVADKEQADAWLKLHNAAIRKLATNP